MRPRVAAAFLALVAFFGTLAGVLAVARVAAAHTIGLSSGEYRAAGDGLVVKLAFARAEILSLVPALDANGDGHATAHEVAAGAKLLDAKIVRRIAVTSGAEACVPIFLDAGLTEEDGLLVSARFDCVAPGDAFVVDAAFLEDLPARHRHVARAASAAVVHDEVLSREAHALRVPRDAVVSPLPAVSPTRATAERGQGVGSFVALGIEHIATGYDHLLFLLGIVLVPAARGANVGPRPRGSLVPAVLAELRALLVVVTAFTIAHSITLGASVLGIWSPSPRFVEPAIALSVAYVGVENFFVESAARRYRITFPFGLVHGFGFAGALREAALPRDGIFGALLGFNVGVEIGQLAVLAIVVPLLVVVRDREWFARRGWRIVSAAVAVAGLVWFVARLRAP